MVNRLQKCDRHCMENGTFTTLGIVLSIVGIYSVWMKKWSVNLVSVNWLVVFHDQQRMSSSVTNYIREV